MDLQSSSLVAAYTLPLQDVTRAHVSRVGAKAANLGELAQAGFPVPDGFVVTAETFSYFLTVNGLDETRTPETILAAEFPPEVAAALRSAYRDLGTEPLAVRSSGVAEDLEGASFAGQYETVLGVVGDEALLNAVRQCWASAFSARVAAYRRNKEGQAARTGMAVLVQKLVPADAAGVAFSANPANGRRDETVISAVRGLGARLVSGEASPDEWIVSNGNVLRCSGREEAIDASWVQAVAKMACLSEAHFGTPQDVEWAVADDMLFILQSRPITALPNAAPTWIPVPANPPPGFWERDPSHLTEPLSPMFRSTVLPAHERATYALSNSLSLPIKGARFREIGGWLYQQIDIAGGQEASPPPAWLMPILVRVVPSLRKMVKGLVVAVREDRLGQAVARWYAEWKPETLAGLKHFKGVDLPSLTDRELDQHLNAVLAFVLECVHIHMLVTAADFLVAEFAIACEDLLGWDGCKSLELLSGLSSQTTEPSKRLADLAGIARERPAVRRMLEQVDRPTVPQLAETDGDFATAFERYLQEFGHRTLRWDINQPTMAERPELILRLIRDQIARGYDPEVEKATLERKRAALLAEARELLVSQPTEKSARFERVLARAERAYPVRDEHEYYLSSAPFALLRYALLEIGTRMTGRRQLDHAEDITFLELKEARAAFHDGSDARATVDRRKGELAWAKAHPGPASYGKAPPPPPSFEAFPPEAQHLMEVIMWQMENMLSTHNSGKLGTTGRPKLRGVAASPGQYSGPARIIISEAEFSRLRAGDVLICPTTQPPWSVVFPTIGALVTDSGGILSHPAIIAREYHVPAVVAIGNATELVKDGQVVTVDGDRGVVEIVE